jgi:hypothetical protein
MGKTMDYKRWIFAILGMCPFVTPAADLECTSWQQQHPEWIWCDDFESDSSLEQTYFEVDRATGRFGVVTSAAFGGIGSLRAAYIPNQSGAGNVKLAIGRNPITKKFVGTGDYQEIYWRIYTKVSSNWTGNAQKVSRAIVFASSNWAEASIGHVWEDNALSLGIGIDPATGVVGSQVVTTKYNDFSNLRWLGIRKAITQIYSAANRDQWFCVEAHMRLNSLGLADGVFELWINDNLEAAASGLDWRGSWSGYGINAIFLENFKNDGVAQSQERYMDNFVVSRSRIGCAGTRPKPPTDVVSE